MKEGYIMRLTTTQDTPMEKIKAKYCFENEVTHSIP